MIPLAPALPRFKLLLATSISIALLLGAITGLLLSKTSSHGTRTIFVILALVAVGTWVSSSLVAAVRNPHAVIKPAKRLGPLLSFATVLTAALLGELILMSYPKSNSIGLTLQAGNWLGQYWNPINSLQYRDPEYSPSELNSKRRVLVLGDSFTAGHGIAHIRDRFTAVLQRDLPERYWVGNLGVCGSDTRSQFKRLVEFPYPPHLVVLAYFGNDIREAAESVGLQSPNLNPYEGLPEIARFLIDKTFLFNYLYWAVPRSNLAEWWNYYHRVYRDEAALTEHRKDLQAFVDYSREHKVPLIVVLFPYLHDLESSAQFTTVVTDFFSAHDVPVLEVASLVDDLSLSERIVNRNDVHPSVLVHERVGHALSKLLRAQGLVDETLHSGSVPAA